MTIPRIGVEAVRAAAQKAGVCVRPVVRRLTDTATGESQLVPIPCQSTLASSCPPCAERARKLRIQQCREGWHLEEEPVTPADTERHQPDRPDEVDEQGVEGVSRRVRSTRRRDDVPDLPRLPVQARTVGRTFTDERTGRVFRPSMFVTLTLPSYGRVHADGTPVDPGTYDYRRAALDALHLSKLWDRFIQNLRRAVGWEVQYFAALEPQKRLAPHIHTAIRGTVPRRILRQVIAATYASVWWPPHHEPVYTGDRHPVWDPTQEAYTDPDTGQVLKTWEQALDELDADPDARPAHVVRFGRQSDIQGLLGGTPDADRRVGYLTKYLTKAITEPLDDTEQAASARREAHIDRLHREVRLLPCSPRCANWLRYGIQPLAATEGMVPGQCGAKTHDREHLGCGGRRVLVSRKWTGKTLAAHRADRANAVRAVLQAAGIDMDDHHTYSATALDHNGNPRFQWEPLDPHHATLDYLTIINTAIAQRNQWRHQYQQAKQHPEPNQPGPFSNSANHLGEAAA